MGKQRDAHSPLLSPGARPCRRCHPGTRARARHSTPRQARLPQWLCRRLQLLPRPCAPPAGRSCSCNLGASPNRMMPCSGPCVCPARAERHALLQRSPAYQATKGAMVLSQDVIPEHKQSDNSEQSRKTSVSKHPALQRGRSCQGQTGCPQRRTQTPIERHLMPPRRSSESGPVTRACLLRSCLWNTIAPASSILASRDTMAFAWPLPSDPPASVATAGAVGFCWALGSGLAISSGGLLGLHLKRQSRRVAVGRRAGTGADPAGAGTSAA